MTCVKGQIALVLHCCYVVTLVDDAKGGQGFNK